MNFLFLLSHFTGRSLILKFEIATITYYFIENMQLIYEVEMENRLSYCHESTYIFFNQRFLTFKLVCHQLRR